MRDTIQVRAMDDYFHSLLLDEPLVLDEVEEVQSAPVLQLQRQPQSVPEVVAAPYLESDPRLAQLGELLAQVGQVQFENDAFTQEVTLTAPLEIVAEESLLPVEPEWPEEVLLPEVAEPHTTILTETALEVAPVEATEPVTWENIDTGKEFQALFFEVAGVTFAVAVDRAWWYSPVGRDHLPVWPAGLVQGDHDLSRAEDECGRYRPVGHAGSASRDG